MQIHTKVPRYPRRHAEVSTCHSITDCNGVVNKESGGGSFSFGRFFPLPRSPHPIPFTFSASCNTDLHSSSLYTRRFQLSPSIVIHLLHLPLPTLSSLSSSLAMSLSPLLTCHLCHLLFPFFTLLLRSKEKSINSPGEIVTRNMEYWVRATLIANSRRRHWEWDAAWDDNFASCYTR